MLNRLLKIPGKDDTAYFKQNRRIRITYNLLHDAATQKVLRKLTLPDGALPRGIVVSGDDQLLYVANGRGKTAAEIRLATNAVTRSLEVGQRPWGLAISPDGKYLYSANGPSNDVSVIDRATWQVISRIPVGKSRGGIVPGSTHPSAAKQ